METKPISHEVTFCASPREVFETLMEAKKHAAFTGVPAEIDRRVGGKFTLYGGQSAGKRQDRGSLVRGELPRPDGPAHEASSGSGTNSAIAYIPCDRRVSFPRVWSFSPRRRGQRDSCSLTHTSDQLTQPGAGEWFEPN